MKLQTWGQAILFFISYPALAFSPGEEVIYFSQDGKTNHGIFLRREVKSDTENLERLAIIQRSDDATIISIPMSHVESADLHFVSKVKKLEVPQQESRDDPCFKRILTHYQHVPFSLEVEQIQPYVYVEIPGETGEEQKARFFESGGTASNYTVTQGAPVGVFYNDLTVKLHSTEEIELLTQNYELTLEYKSSLLYEISLLKPSQTASVSLKLILPAFVRNNLGLFLIERKGDEANCINTALCFHNPNRDVEYTDAKEFIPIAKNAFRELNPEETLKPGDIVSVWRNKDEFRNGTGRRGHKHSAVYVGGHFFFGKASNSELDPYGFQSFYYNFYPYIRSNPDAHFTFHRRLP